MKDPSLFCINILIAAFVQITVELLFRYMEVHQILIVLNLQDY